MAVEIGSIYDSGAPSDTGDRHAEFESYLGHPTTYARIFFTPADSQTNPPSGPWATVANAINQGYWVHISPKTTLAWSQVATTSTDIAHWQAIGDWMSQFPLHSPNPHLFTFWHEMDNDGPTGNDTNDGATFQAAFNRVAVIIKSRAPNWRTCCVYSNGTFTQVSNGVLLHGGPYLWWPSEAQYVGHDFYFRRSSAVGYADSNSVIADLPPSRLYVSASGRIGSSLFAAEKGVPLVLPEFGVNVKNPSTTTGGVAGAQADRASIVQQYMDAWKLNATNLRGINYYDRGTPSGFRPYAIAGGSPEPVCSPDTPTLNALYSVTQGSAQPPLVTSFTPTSGIVGTAVTITGTNFTGATSVRFNGLVSAYTVLSPTTIVATVPTGATTGVIRVQSGAGFDDSNTAFTVTVAGAFLGSVSPATRVKGVA